MKINVYFFFFAFNHKYFRFTGYSIPGNTCVQKIRDGDFADFFFQCFQSSAFLRISAVSSFLHSIQRERNAETNAYKITLTEPEREMQKNCSQKNIPNRASAQLTSEQ